MEENTKPTIIKKQNKSVVKVDEKPVLAIKEDFLFKKESMGGGDIKLMFFIGCTVGPWMSMFSIFLSSFIALPLSLILYYKSIFNFVCVVNYSASCLFIDI